MPLKRTVDPSSAVKKTKAVFKGDLPGTHKDMGPLYGKRDPYYSIYSHTMNPYLYGLLWEWYGNRMGKGSHYWGSLEKPLTLPKRAVLIQLEKMTCRYA